MQLIFDVFRGLVPTNIIVPSSPWHTTPTRPSLSLAFGCCMPGNAIALPFNTHSAKHILKRCEIHPTQQCRWFRSGWGLCGLNSSFNGLPPTHSTGRDCRHHLKLSVWSAIPWHVHFQALLFVKNTIVLSHFNFYLQAYRKVFVVFILLVLSCGTLSFLK